MVSESEEQRIRDIIEDWANAVMSGDRAKILARHSSDLLMFDFPETIEGIEAYARTWDFFFADPKGPITYRPTSMRVTAGKEVAFAACTFHCDGTSAGPLDFRLTVGLEKRDGEWVITHEHHSVPTIEERFIEE
ncbi:nuclear transport factor 2 family protein [Rhizobium sp. LCM 4573]|uniref:nuclear transport factor 2 family protein n=1 Tax=Rhizobium sp. LCM 4573 TaxID=1848291 RepID=UPI0008DA00AE|nr:nuclear transport factor 2 family protein [Rhizobium sp. LCM 4573]OHV76029.1 hypothetical protein LCM4573_15415 [Rhizobium sp. LCM 4573]